MNEKISKQLSKLKQDQALIANNLNAKGQPAQVTDKLDTLANYILNIASGDIKLGNKEITEDGEYRAYNDNLDGYSLVNVNVLKGINYVGSFVGSGSSIKKNVKIYNDVPAYAFKDIELNKVELVNSNKIGDYAFYSSGILEFINNKPLIVGERAFYLNSNLEYNITISEEQQIIYPYTFYTCSKMTFNIPNNITKIGDYAFYNCNLNNMESLPSELESIGTYAFNSNSSLKLTELPPKLTTIKSYAFRSSGLETIKIPDSCRSIAEGAFRYNSELNTVEIGTGILSLTKYCFANDTVLKTFIIHKKTPPTLQSTTFNSTNLEVIKVPNSALELYKKATNWSKFADIMVGIEGE